MFRFFHITLLLINVSGLVACQQSSTDLQPLILSGYTMGTSYTVKINEPVNNKTTDDIHKALENKLDMINASMSTWLDDSELSRINRSSGQQWLPLSTPLFEVLLASFQVNTRSIGYFDITVGPLVNLWGFGPGKKSTDVPDTELINAAMASVGMDKILLDTNKKMMRKKVSDVYIDLSGIAKGYAVDELGQILYEKFDLRNFMVEIGGEIVARGVNPEGVAWRIGIEKPVVERRSVNTIVELVNTALASSGDYRNFIEIDGKHFSHTIDPVTGRPVTHELAAVTVIHPSCMLADAWATAILAAGPDVGIQIANMNQLAAQFTLRYEGRYIQKYTDSFKAYLQQH